MMCSKSPVFSTFRFTLALALALFSGSHGFELVVTDTKLPGPRVYHSAVYDGQDSVYIVEGFDGFFQRRVVKYFIDAGSVEVVGNLTHILHYGDAVITQNGDILYFGGDAVGGAGLTSNVTRFSTRTGVTDVVAQLPFPIEDHAVAWDAENQVAYIFGGYSHEKVARAEVLRYDARAHQVEIVATLPETRTSASAVWANGVAYVIGDWNTWQGRSREVLRFDPSTNTVTKMEYRLPFDAINSQSVFDEVNQIIYIQEREGLMTFNVVTNQTGVMWPVGWPAYISDTACVYVPKVRRMYLFGGDGRFAGEDRNRIMDEIMYMNL